MGGCARVVDDGGSRVVVVVVGVDWKEFTTHSSEDPSSKIMHMSVNIGKEVGTTIILVLLDNFFDGYNIPLFY